MARFTLARLWLAPVPLFMIVVVLLEASCGGGTANPPSVPSPTSVTSANPMPASSAVRRGTAAQEELTFTGTVTGQITSAVTQCVIFKRGDPDGMSDVFQGVITGGVSGASHALRIVLQKYTGAGTYENTAEVLRATGVVDAGAPAAANVTVNADGKSGTIGTAGATGDRVSGSWSCSAVVTIG